MCEQGKDLWDSNKSKNKTKNNQVRHKKVFENAWKLRLKKNLQNKEWWKQQQKNSKVEKTWLGKI